LNKRSYNIFPIKKYIVKYSVGVYACSKLHFIVKNVRMFLAVCDDFSNN